MRNRIAALFLSSGILALFPLSAAAQWVPTGGPGGCHITALAMSGTKIFAGTSHHGVFVSADQGATWTPATSGLPLNKEVDDLVAVGTALFVASRGRIFVSTNYGASWKPAGSGPIGKLWVDCLAASGRAVFAGTNKGPFMTEDNGESWKAVNTGLPSDDAIFYLLVRGPGLYAGMRDGVFFSADLGATWKQVGPELPLGHTFQCLEVSGTDLIAGTNNGLFLAAGNGGSWKAVSSGLPKDSRISCLIARGPGLYASTGDGVYLSADRGASWDPSGVGSMKAGVVTLAASEKLLFAGTYDGMFVSSDEGAHWRSVSSGLPSETDVHSLAAIGQSLFVCAGAIMVSSDSGESWTELSSGMPAGKGTWSGQLFVSGSDLFVHSWTDSFVSADNGASWRALGWEGIMFSGDLFDCGGILYATNPYYNNVLYSKDRGKTWKHMDFHVVVNCFCAGGSDLFAGTSGLGKSSDMEGVSAVNSVFKSKDGGATWKQATPSFSAPINCLAAIGPNVFIGTDRGLYFCGDFGECPTPSKLELSEEVSVKCFQVVGTRLFVGTDKGVYLIGNTGGENDWGALNTRFPPGREVSCFAVIGRYLFAGTSGAGVWRYTIPR